MKEETFIRTGLMAHYRIARSADEILPLIREDREIHEGETADPRLIERM